jgi:two-component system alkaline phosphatase synthesis response regulator PhoP
MSHQVLLVDDDDPTRFVYHEILTRMGFEVWEAEDGLKAIELLSARAPHVVVLDLLLPKKSGREVLDFIYKSPALNNTRVIIFSAHESLYTIELRPGDVFLLKPLNPQLLREAVLRATSSTTSKH